MSVLQRVWQDHIVLLRDYKHKNSVIVIAGANDGRELFQLAEYGFRNFVLVEPFPNAFNILRQNCEKLRDTFPDFS
jgi:hypothetical protein